MTRVVSTQSWLWRWQFSHCSFSPDLILCGWLGLKHQLTDNPTAPPTIRTCNLLIMSPALSTSYPSWVMYTDCKTLRRYVIWWNILNLNDVFSAPSIQPIRWTYTMLTDSNKHSVPSSSSFSHFFTGICLQDRYIWYYFWLTDVWETQPWSLMVLPSLYEWQIYSANKKYRIYWRKLKKCQNASSKTPLCAKFQAFYNNNNGHLVSLI